MKDAVAKDGPKYRAPAPEKSREILEVLAASPAPISTSEISLALRRSVSEIFRMLQVLEERGYIVRRDERYRLTNRLFLLGMAEPPLKDLLSVALPTMHRLAEQIGQSCHLAVASGAETVVVAAVEPPGLLGFLGARRRGGRPSPPRCGRRAPAGCRPLQCAQPAVERHHRVVVSDPRRRLCACGTDGALCRWSGSQSHARRYAGGVGGAVAEIAAKLAPEAGS